LAFLLQHYCNVTTDKRFQLADWRIRPLPSVMLNYAQMDTHYLLYIYDMLRNALVERGVEQQHQNLLRTALMRSKDTSLKVYEKDVYDVERGEGTNGWRTLLNKYKRALDRRQVAVLKGLHQWRDQVARTDDESIQYVLPNGMLFKLATSMPVDERGVLTCCHPAPPHVKMYAQDMAILIRRAKQVEEVKMQTPVVTKQVEEKEEEMQVEVEVTLMPVDKAWVQETSRLFGPTPQPPKTTRAQLLAKRLHDQLNEVDTKRLVQ
jgi:exosome complex exonuclease RRP6